MKLQKLAARNREASCRARSQSKSRISALDEHNTTKHSGKGGNMGQSELNAGEVGAIVLTPEEVAKKDAFKVHTRIAHTLKSIIVSNNGGGAIGLEGDWGSGKSTVVHFLKSLLENGGPQETEDNNGFHLAIFDAWSHEGDELRRAFLDQLAEQVVTDAKLTRAKQQIWQSSKTVETNTHRRLSFNVFLAVASLALSPTAAGLLSTFSNDTTSIFSDRYIQSILLFLAVSPGFVLLKATLWSILRWFFDCSGQGFGHFFRDEFRGQSPDDGGPVTTTTIQSAENSIDEFEQLLSNILEQRQPNISTLVIAIDNIDRLSKVLTRSFWTALTPLFDAVRRKELCPGLRVWVLLPFDRSSLKRAFGADDFEGFIDKTFDTVILVPPPLLMRWRSYMEKQLINRFPELEQKNKAGDLQAIIDLFALAEDAKVTPRSIAKFINNLVVLWEQQANHLQIPLVVAAAFLLSGKNLQVGKDQKNIILSSGHLKEEDIPLHYGALYYGVDLKDAPQVLMFEQMLQAVYRHDVNTIRSFQDYSGFSVVARNVLRHALPREQDSSHSSLFETLETFTKVDQKYLDKKFWACTFPSMRHHRAWANSIEQLASIIPLLFDRFSAKQDQQLLCKEFAAILKEPLHEKTDAACWLQAADSLIAKKGVVELPDHSNSIKSIMQSFFSEGKYPYQFRYGLPSTPPDVLNLAISDDNINLLHLLAIGVTLAEHDKTFLANFNIPLETMRQAILGDLKEFRLPLTYAFLSILPSQQEVAPKHLLKMLETDSWVRSELISNVKIGSAHNITFLVGSLLLGPHPQITGPSPKKPSSDVNNEEVFRFTLEQDVAIETLSKIIITLGMLPQLLRNCQKHEIIKSLGIEILCYALKVDPNHPIKEELLALAPKARQPFQQALNTADNLEANLAAKKQNKRQLNESDFT